MSGVFHHGVTTSIQHRLRRCWSLSLLAQRKEPKKWRPSSPPYASSGDDTYGVPALLDKARHPAQLPRRHFSFKRRLRVHVRDTSTAPLGRQCSPETPRLVCDCSAALMGPRAHVVGSSTESGVVTPHRKALMPLRGGKSSFVCERLELKTRSAVYLRRHVTPGNLGAISKRLIIEATNRIEARS